MNHKTHAILYIDYRIEAEEDDEEDMEEEDVIYQPGYEGLYMYHSQTVFLAENFHR